MMDVDDPFDILEEALSTARLRGYPATGWMLSSDDDGFAAWLFQAEGDVEGPLWSESELMPTPLMAAKECYSRASQLEHREDQDN